jgi:hypothetical protein
MKGILFLLIFSVLCLIIIYKYIFVYEHANYMIDAEALNVRKCYAHFISRPADIDLRFFEKNGALNAFPVLIDNLLWSENGYKPQVSFKIAYTQSSIILKYHVLESHLRAVIRQTNGPVFKDSCVEFFLSLESNNYYYNFEFNCLGTALVGYGSGKEKRVYIDRHLIDKISTYQIIHNSAKNKTSLIEWELVINIPFEIFAYHHLTSLKGVVCTANFYKCGDDLPEPHFLSWNPINHPNPDFHLPAFFGQIHFIA